MKTLDLDEYSHLPPISNIYDVPEWWQMTITPLSRYTPIRGKMGNLMISPSDGQPSTAPLSPRRKLCDPAMCPPLRTFSTSTAATGQTGAPHRSDRSTGQTSLVRRSDRSGAVVDPPSLRTWLSAQPRNPQWFCGEPLVKPRR